MENIDRCINKMVLINFTFTDTYTVQSKKVNRVSHDYHGSVGSPSLNITVTVIETYLSPLISKFDSCQIQQNLN
jgi:hypothetical protein